MLSCMILLLVLLRFTHLEADHLGDQQGTGLYKTVSLTHFVVVRLLARMPWFSSVWLFHQVSSALFILLQHSKSSGKRAAKSLEVAWHFCSILLIKENHITNTGQRGEKSHLLIESEKKLWPLSLPQWP